LALAADVSTSAGPARPPASVTAAGHGRNELAGGHDGSAKAIVRIAFLHPSGNGLDALYLSGYDAAASLAGHLNGALLPDHALRLIVPGEHRAARPVRDVIRIDIE
jgi:hypothetical protein